MSLGVLLMSYGTPASLDEVEAYYTHVRRGRPPAPEQLEELKARYAAIGGNSTLRERTNAQAGRIDELLGQRLEVEYRMLHGAKHSTPFIEDAFAELVDKGATSVVGVVLSPHRSRAGTDQYHDRGAETATKLGVPYTPVRSWSQTEAFVAFHASAITDALATMKGTPQVVFTAHSLPETSLEGDSYPDDLYRSAAAIAKAAGLASWGAWGIGWQSAGKTGTVWRGPDILDIIDELAALGRTTSILVVPQGFSSDHLEVAYDLDIEASKRAADHGIEFARTRTVNDDVDVMSSIADLLVDAAG